MKKTKTEKDVKKELWDHCLWYLEDMGVINLFSDEENNCEWVLPYIVEELKIKYGSYSESLYELYRAHSKEDLDKILRNIIEEIKVRNHIKEIEHRIKKLTQERELLIVAKQGDEDTIYKLGDRAYKDATRWGLTQEQREDCYYEAIYWLCQLKDKISTDYRLNLILGKCFLEVKEYDKSYEHLYQAKKQGGQKVESEVDILFIKYFELTKEGAERGDDALQCRLGEAYLFGGTFGGALRRTSVSKNINKALEWLNKSAEQGYFSAMRRLGDYYYHKEGEDQRYSKALYWYEKASSLNPNYYKSFLIERGDCYYFGDEIKDYEKAFNLYMQSAEQGNTSAMDKIGDCFKNGYGVEQNNEKAEEWYKKAKSKRSSLELERKIREARDKQDEWKQILTEMSDSTDAFEGDSEAVWNID